METDSFAIVLLNFRLTYFLFQLFIKSSRFELLLAIGGAFLFSMLIIYDTWMAIHRLSPEEYVLACIDLYLDIINLFLHILKMVDAARHN